jgi:hypothetical protein
VTDPAQPIESPCVRNCCLDESDVCMGCHRTLTEICNWQAASLAEKLAILERCRERAAVEGPRNPRKAW